MCLSPIRIHNPQTYKVFWNSASTFEVPCGHCEECRNANVTEWQTRISFEIQHTYAKHGCCIFLTFTYNDEHLPIYSDDSCGLYIPAFSREDVFRCLNRVKVWANKKYGKGSYKYIWCSEYGKFTRRPHYHCLFFLGSLVDPIAFALKCRSAWQPLGFMFPKWSDSRQCFVDNSNNPSDILLRDRAGGAKYISKYVTKDMSYFGMPEVDSYINDPDPTSRQMHRNMIQGYLPRHWQSNHLGSSILDSIDLSTPEKVNDLFSKGIWNPITQEYDPIPRYLLNQLIYKRECTKGHYYERSSDLTAVRVYKRTGEIKYINKKVYLYDRVYSDFGRKYMRCIFDNRINRRCVKLSELFQRMKYDESFLQVLPKLHYFNINLDDSSTFYPLAVYHDVLRHFGSSPLLHYLGRSLDISNRDSVFKLWMSSHDTAHLRANNNSHVCNTPFLSVPLAHLRYLDSYYKYYSINFKTGRYLYNSERYDKLTYLKRELCSRFDTKLC